MSRARKKFLILFPALAIYCTAGFVVLFSHGAFLLALPCLAVMVGLYMASSEDVNMRTEFVFLSAAAIVLGIVSLLALRIFPATEGVVTSLGLVFVVYSMFKAYGFYRTLSRTGSPPGVQS